MLQNFKCRINKYRAISYSKNGSSQFEQYNQVPMDVKNSYASGNLGAAYYFIKSTERILLTANTGLYSSVAAGKAITQSAENTSSNFNVAPSINVLHKWLAKNNVTELGAIVNYNYGSSKYRQTNPVNKEKNNQDIYAVAILTGIGKGRLENVTNMQNGL